MNVKLLAKQLVSRNEELQKYASTYFDEIYKSNKYNYKHLTEIIEKNNSELKDEDIKTILTGYIISKPFGRGKFLGIVEEALNNENINLKRAINENQRIMFQQRFPQFYTQLQTLEYKKEMDGHLIKLTRNPQFIKEITAKTSSCIHDEPNKFFEQIVNDPGTIYLVAKNEDPNGPTGYSRLYAYSGEATNNNILIADTMWFTGKDKSIANKLVKGMSDIANIIEKEILNFRMSGEFITKHGNRADVFQTKDKYYKIGHTPHIHRFAKPVITPTDDFYCINYDKD